MTFRNGQSSIETLMVFLFVLFMLVVLALFASERNRESSDLKMLIDLRRICSSFADNINNIAEQGPGFYRYFSLPAYVYGYSDYSVYVYRNFVEVSAGNHSVIDYIVYPNVSIYCLDKDLMKKNKVYNEGVRLLVLCHRPELFVLNGSVWPRKVVVDEVFNFSVRVMNFGPVESGNFTVLFNDSVPVRVYSVPSEEVVEVGFTMTAPQSPGIYNVSVLLDSGNEVDESMEDNNFYRGFIYVVSS